MRGKMPIELLVEEHRKERKARCPGQPGRSSMKKIKAFNFNVVDHSIWIIPLVGKSIKIDINESLAVRSHATTRFEWGYHGGPGMAQTALAILLKVVDEKTAVRFYHQFKWEVIVKLEFGKSHRLPMKTIKAWLKWKLKGVSGGS